MTVYNAGRRQGGQESGDVDTSRRNLQTPTRPLSLALTIADLALLLGCDVLERLPDLVGIFSSSRPSTLLCYLAWWITVSLDRVRFSESPVPSRLQRLGALQKGHVDVSYLLIVRQYGHRK